MLTIGLGHYLTLGAILFTLGVFGIFLNRRNVIIILMSIELMLLAVNINMVAFWRYGNTGSMAGQVFSIINFAVAAAEVAVGLSLVYSVYRRRNTIVADELDLMKW